MTPDKYQTLLSILPVYIWQIGVRYFLMFPCSLPQCFLMVLSCQVTVGLMERHILFLSVKAQSIASARALRPSPPVASLLRPLLEMLDEVNLAPGFSFPC